VRWTSGLFRRNGTNYTEINMESTAMDESGCEEVKCEVREWATAIKTDARYDNIALGPEQEALKASGRRENKIKRNPITEERGMK
jgi:hypothetical protein